MRHRVRNPFGRRIGAALAITTVAAAIAATVAFSAGTARLPQRRSAHVAQVVSPRLSAELPVLGRPANRADLLPAGVEGSPAHWLQEGLAGANGALARRTGESKDGAVYLIPSSTGVCVLASAGPPNLCATTSELESGEAQEATVCSPELATDEVQIAGLLPADATDPAAVLSNGRRVPLDLEGGIFIADFTRSGPLPTSIA